MTTTNCTMINSTPGYPDIFGNTTFFETHGDGAGFIRNTGGSESLCQTAAGLAMTDANLAVRVTTNTFGAGAAACIFRKAGADGNQSVAIGGGGANTWITDSSHTDVLALGDLYCTAIRMNSGGPDCLIGLITSSVSGASPRVEYMWASINPNSSMSSGACYPLLGGSNAPEASENTYVQTPLRSAGTLSYMSANIASTTLTATLTSRKNAGAGNQSLALSNTNGVVTDSTHTDAVVSGDTADNKITSLTVGTGLSLYSIAYGFAGTTSKQDLVSSSSSGAPFSTSSTTAFHVPSAAATQSVTSEAKAEVKLPYAATASNLLVQTGSNGSAAGTLTMTSRKNAGAGNQSVTLTTTTAAAIYEDVTHTDSYVIGDFFNAQSVTAAATNQVVANINISLNDGSNTGAATAVCSVASTGAGPC